MGNNYYNFTARASTKVSLYCLRKDTLKNLYQKKDDLYKEVTEAKNYFKTAGMPYVDFCLPRMSDDEIKPIHIFKLSVARLMRIIRTLYRYNTADEVLGLLRDLQQKYNSPSKTTAAEETNKKTMEMIETLMMKFDSMKMELNDQRRLIDMKNKRPK